jgi:uncharacterized repeat protein (TIGR01451 family)
VLTDGVSVLKPKAIPGATVQYCILVTNTGPVTTTSATAVDTLPPNISYVVGSMTSGTSCANATTPEDDNAAGVDENDPFGMNIAATTITGSAATLGVGSSFAMVFSTTVN